MQEQLGVGAEEQRVSNLSNYNFEEGKNSNERPPFIYEQKLSEPYENTDEGEVKDHSPSKFSSEDQQEMPDYQDKNSIESDNGGMNGELEF